MVSTRRENVTNLTQVRRGERDALLLTLRELGPTAPTLCSQWAADDIAAHLVVSEQGWGLPMVTVYWLRRLLPLGAVRRGTRALQTVGDRKVQTAKRRGWERLLYRLASGPPVPYRLRSVASIRFVEEWIHHEDIRRANGCAPRTDSPQVDEALWRAGLALTAFREFRADRDGLELVLPDGRTHRLGTTTRARIEGRPGEILLFLAGRSVADVRVDGEEAFLRELDRTRVV
jgi:uncharacterized protein (TIGR03085 family)